MRNIKSVEAMNSEKNWPVVAEDAGRRIRSPDGADVRAALEDVNGGPVVGIHDARCAERA